MKLLVFIFTLMLMTAPLWSQDLEELPEKLNPNKFFSDFKDAEPFSISGSLALNLRSYNTSAQVNRQSPYTWFVGGQVNMSIYKINIPLSMTLSTQSETFSHPFHIDGLIGKRFTRLGASPYYKFVKLHLGHRSMNFSPFTMANHTFLGVGTEVTPGNYRFAAFYGRMAKTEPRDRSLLNPNQEIYRRKAFGFKVGYGTEDRFIDLILFKAKDDPSLIDPTNEADATSFQNENLVLGLNGRATLIERLTLKLEIASSAFTKNVADAQTGQNQFPHPSFLFTPYRSTIFRSAYNAGLEYALESSSIGLNYKRVEPEYRTLGAYFFNDDLENYTINARIGLLNNALNIAGSLGIQKNNVFGDNLTDFKRTISSLNVDYSVNALNLGVNYSNYTSDVQFVLNLGLDSLNAVVVTQQGGINASYALRGKNETRHTFATSVSLQTVADDVQNPGESAESRMLTGNFTYALRPGQSSWKYRARLNYNKNELSQILITRYGAGLGIQGEVIPDKLSIKLDANFFSSTGQNINNQTLNVRLGIPFSLGEKHNFDLGILYLNRLKGSGTAGTFNEMTSIFNYTLSF